MSSAAILRPNQLFAEHPGLETQPDQVVLFEDPLFFGDAIYPAKMHKQKLWLHRASMARYRDNLVARGFKATNRQYEPKAGACVRLFEDLRQRGVSEVTIAEPVDFISEKRLLTAANEVNITLDLRPSPGFLNTRTDNLDWSAGRKRWFMAEFYKSQRRHLNVLMEGDQPRGGQWSFDEDSRKKVPV
ncbi:MAG: cryptochrome/photolyase family protein [Pseudomonadota bacterium]